MKFFIITYDRAVDESYKDFHKEFISLHGVDNWFHYIKSSYIIGSSTLTAENITDHFLYITNKYALSKNHLVLEVNLSNRQGYLSKDAWNWISENSLKYVIS